MFQDEIPLVRKAASQSFGDFVSQLAPDIVIKEFLTPLDSVVRDHQDSVRIFAIQNCIVVAKVIGIEMSLSIIRSLVDCLFCDPCWRVRFTCAERVIEIAAVFNHPSCVEWLLGHYIELMKDQEAEIRTMACKEVSRFSSILPHDLVLNHICPSIAVLSSDESEFVKSCLATNMMDLCRILPPTETKQVIVPVALKLLKDSNPDIRLNVVARLDAIVESVGMDQISKALMPAIIDLALDRKWRTRLAIVEKIPTLGTALVGLYVIRTLTMLRGWNFLSRNFRRFV